MAEDKRNSRKVLVTGFGPFAGHPTNASWEAVKELRNSDIESTCDVTLITEEIPVTYEGVTNQIPKLWSEHDPMLVVHVGVSALAACLTLESQAHGDGYVKLDVDKKCALKKSDGVLDDIIIGTEIDVRRICESINNGCGNHHSSNGEEAEEEGEGEEEEEEETRKCRAVVSENAGRYLCEYIFYKSLTIHPGKTIFVHVPDLAIYSAAKTAEGLCEVIKSALAMIEKKSDQ